MHAPIHMFTFIFLFAATLGGTLGISFGASFLTLFEFVDFGFVAAVNALWGRIKNNKMDTINPDTEKKIPKQ